MPNVESLCRSETGDRIPAVGNRRESRAGMRRARRKDTKRKRAKPEIYIYTYALPLSEMYIYIDI